MGDIFEKVKAADDIVSETIHVNEWGLDIDVRTMNGEALERLDFESELFRAELLIATCYEQGTNDFAFPNTDEARDMLMAKAGIATSRLLRVAMRINGFSKEGREELKND